MSFTGRFPRAEVEGPGLHPGQVLVAPSHSDDHSQHSWFARAICGKLPFLAYSQNTFAPDSANPVRIGITQPRVDAAASTLGKRLKPPTLKELNPFRVNVRLSSTQPLQGRAEGRLPRVGARRQPWAECQQPLQGCKKAPLLGTAAATSEFFTQKSPSSRAEAKIKMSFTGRFPRAEVEGPSLNKGQVLVASGRFVERGRFSLSALATSGKPSIKNKIFHRLPHLLEKQPGPSTAARLALLRKGHQQLASAQDDGVFYRGGALV